MANEGPRRYDSRELLRRIVDNFDTEGDALRFVELMDEARDLLASSSSPSGEMASAIYESVAMCSHCDWRELYDLRDAEAQRSAGVRLLVHAASCAANPLVQQRDDERQRAEAAEARITVLTNANAELLTILREAQARLTDLERERDDLIGIVQGLQDAVAGRTKPISEVRASRRKES